MITHDADMLRFAATGTDHAGVCYSYNQRYKPGQLISKLIALADLVSASEMMNRVEFL